MRHTVEDYSAGDLSARQQMAIELLLWKVWPPEVRALFVVRPNTPPDQKPALRSYVVWEKGAAIAHAHAFVRQIRTEARPVITLALAGVCVHPDRRGLGLGQRVVESALSELGREGSEIGFWQTGVPSFYEKLGARLVHNRFYNSLDPEDTARDPFWEKHIMIYPAGADWPEGPVDIGGPGF